MVNYQHTKHQFTKLQTLNLYEWTPYGPPKAVIIIIHGMMEHAQRYQDIAHYLVEMNFAVFSLDLPGHGQTGMDSGLMGHLPPTGWQWICESVLNTVNICKEKYPIPPLFLLGHSMGSYIAQTITRLIGNQLSGLILSGTSYESPSMMLWANRFLNFLSKWIDSDQEVPFIHNLIFNNYNKGFKTPDSKHAWLSRAPKQVEAYEKDPWCGNICTLGFYQELTLGLFALYTEENFQELAKFNTLPILFQYGSHDALSKGGKSIQTLIEHYKKIGYTNLTQICYPKARHEVYQEINKETIYHELSAWIYKQL